MELHSSLTRRNFKVFFVAISRIKKANFPYILALKPGVAQACFCIINICRRCKIISGLGSDECRIHYHMGVRGTEVLKSQKNTIFFLN